ncbi:MAG: hypothetical protein MN733_11825 [Nitrososphaera sp.]|nr:hypothetical protein [Nitrososphaera sp.]
MNEEQKQVSLLLKETVVAAGQELHGIVLINYSGRFDSLVINSQIENSSDVFSYTNLNGKKIKHPYARLSIFRAELGGSDKVEFTATTGHVPVLDQSSVKFRVSIIQEHKEIFSDLAYVKIIRP